jgi:hypothetical protein
MIRRNVLWLAAASVLGAGRGGEIAPGPATVLGTRSAMSARGPVVPLDSTAIAQALGRPGARQRGRASRHRGNRGAALGTSSKLNRVVYQRVKACRDRIRFSEAGVEIPPAMAVLPR